MRFAYVNNKKKISWPSPLAALNVMGLGRGRSSHRGRGHVSRLALFDGSSKNLWLAFRRNHQRTESPLESDNWAITRNAGGQNARQTQPANK